MIGDSIRMGYDKFVAMALEGQAEVYYPAENCRFTQYALRHFQDWVKDSGFGVNDLFGLLENVPDDHYSDMTHFYTEPATRLITNRVLAVIQEQIGITGKELDFTGLFGASNDDIGM